MTSKKRPKKLAESPASVRESFASGPDGTNLYVRYRSASPGETRWPRTNQGPQQLNFLLCDGIVCDGYIYKYLWEDLAQLGSVAHWNYRGHGRSSLPRDPKRITIPDHAADLNCVREWLGDPPLVLVGHSLGTQVVLEAYRQRPQRVAAMVLMNGSVGRVTYTFKGSDLLATLLPNLISAVVRYPRVTRALWSRIPPGLGLALGVLSRDVNVSAVRVEDIRPYFEHAASVDFELFLRMLREAGEHSAEDVLPTVEPPVLVLAGGKDSFTPPELSQAMVRSLPHAQLVLVPTGTHILPLEERELVRESITNFLTGVTKA